LAKNKPGVQIVHASVQDAGAILNVQKLAYLRVAELYQNYDISPLTQTREEIAEQFKTNVFLNAVSEGEIIGTVRAYEKDGTCFIGKLAVHPRMQGRGVGTALMEKIEGQFRPKRFELFTGAKNQKNIELYQKLGYSILRKAPYGCGGIEVFYMEKNCPKDKMGSTPIKEGTK
jgi:ribosomal protein S18 acetylase RimI-like enzyme